MKNIDIEDYDGTYVMATVMCRIFLFLQVTARFFLQVSMVLVGKMLSEMKKRKKSKLSAGEILPFYISIICQTFFF